MRSLAIACLVSIGAFLCWYGCSSSNKGKIEGTIWTSETAVYKGKRLPPGSIRLEFRENGTVRHSAGWEVRSGTYTLGKRKTVHLKMQQDGKQKESSVTVVIEDEELVMTEASGASVTFKRVR